MPQISVIVVNYNGGEYLSRCVASLENQTFRDFEVIIVDNASSDGSIEALDPLPANFRIIEASSNLGFATANNMAAAQAGGQWLALLNPDASAFPDWLGSLLDAVNRRPTHRIVASLQYRMDDLTRIDGVGDCYSIDGYPWRGGFRHHSDEIPPAGEVFAACGASAFYPKDAFLAAGGFDESFFCYIEDVDLGFRLRLAGEHCQFDPSCKIEHAGGTSSASAAGFADYHGIRNTVWTITKNMPMRLLPVVIPLWALVTLALYLKSPASKRDTMRNALKSAVQQISPILTARQAVQRTRKISVFDVAKSLSWNVFDHVSYRPGVRQFSA